MNERAYSPDASFQYFYFDIFTKMKLVFKIADSSCVFSVMTASVMNKALFIEVFVSLIDTCLFHHSIDVFSSVVFRLSETYFYLQFTNIFLLTLLWSIMVNNGLHVVHLYCRHIVRFLFVEYGSNSSR